MTAAQERPVTLGRVFRLWWPLAGSWALMGVEMPLFAAVVARMADAKVNLAAWSSMVFPIALVIEGPIMMLLAAGTALARDRASYRKLYRFMMAAGAALTALHALIAFTPLFHVVADVMRVEPDLRGPARLGLAIMLPWTWAIAHRRLQQGVLIRYGHSGDVWIGTLSRLACNAAVLIAGLAWGGASGIVVGATGVATGVTAEMVYVAWRTRAVVRGPLASAPAAERLTRGGFLVFYAPLALSPMLLLLVQPLAAAAMNRLPESRESLASWTPVWSLVFTTRSVGFALNEVVVALLGRPGAVAALRRFTLILATTMVGLLTLIAATPLAELWFRRVLGLPPDLVAIGRYAVGFAVLMPGYQAIQSWYQGALLHEHKTRPVTEAVVLYLGSAGVLLAGAIALAGGRVGFLDGLAGHEGIYYALACLSIAGLGQTAWLARRARGGLRRLTARPDAAAA